MRVERIVKLAVAAVVLGSTLLPMNAADATTCIPLTNEQVGSLQLASGPTITNGVAVRVPKDKRPLGLNGKVVPWPRYLVAANIHESLGIAVWAVGVIDATSIGGGVDSLNDSALAATEFGAAAQPGSTAMQRRKQLVRLPQYVAVLKCFAAAPATD